MKTTRYYLALDGISWREITRDQARRLLPMVVARHSSFITMRTFTLDPCLADSRPVDVPQLRLIFA